MNIESKTTTQQKAAAAFGLDQPSALDSLSRSNFRTDEEYVDAAVRLEMERNSPEHQRARRRVEAEYRARQEQAQRAEQEAAYKAIRSSVKLDDLDRREIDAEAASLARRDLASGRIGASELGTAIEKYAAELAEERKGRKAANQLMNSLLRGNR